jgi:hypothetical protein
LHLSVKDDKIVVYLINDRPVASHWQTLSHCWLLEEQEQVQNYNKKFILMRNSAIQCLMYLITLKMLQNIKKKRINDKLIQIKLTSLKTGRLASPGPSISSTNKTNYHDIADILLKMA